MSSFLQNLENNEAILLMYLANELPADDREEVEAMLKQDATLRDQLTQLRDAYHRFDQTMLLGDAGTALASGYVTARAIGETARRRYAVTRSVDDHEEAHRRMHWVIYPVAAAAVLAIGMLVWWKSATDEMNKPVSPLISNNGPGGQFDPFRRDFSGGGRWGRPMVNLAVVPAGTPTDVDDDTLAAAFESVVMPPRYSNAQRQLAALDYLDETWQ